MITITHDKRNRISAIKKDGEEIGRVNWQRNQPVSLTLYPPEGENLDDPAGCINWDDLKFVMSEFDTAVISGAVVLDPSPVDRAYIETMAAVEEIRKQGIKIVITDSSARNRADMVKKYARPDRVTPERWVCVTFHLKADADAGIVSEHAQRLLAKGIIFDTGGSGQQRDWELDWSFTYRPKPA